MTDKEKNILDSLDLDIEDIIYHYGIDNILDEINTFDIALHYDLDDILDEYRSNNDIAEYLDSQGFDFTPYIEEEDKIDTTSEDGLLVEFCRRLHPYGVLTKNDIKEIINDYLDTMFIDKIY